MLAAGIVKNLPAWHTHNTGGHQVALVGMTHGNFIVDDTGIGIRQDELSRVFQRFFRGESARSRTDGAGLGLSIASWIAREHGATISLKSEPGKGTKVVVTFPRAVVS